MDELYRSFNVSPVTQAADKQTEVKRRVREKLRSGAFILSSEKRGRSPVWQHFRMVIDEEGKQLAYAGCLYCLEVLKHDPHLTGTSSLFNHLKSCPVAKMQHGSPPIVTEVHVKDEVVEEEPRHPLEHDLEHDLEHEAVRACADFVIRDLFPYQTLSGDGFRAWAKFLVECGANYGKVAIENLLPKPNQLSEGIRERANAARATVTNFINQSCCMALTTNKINRGSDSIYVAMSIHHLDDCGILHRTFLGLCKFPNDSTHRYTHCIRECLPKFNFKDLETQFSHVSNDSNIVMALPEKHISLMCCDHMINQVLLHTFEKSHLSGSEIYKLIEKVGCIRSEDNNKIFWVDAHNLKCFQNIENSRESVDLFKTRKDLTIKDKSQFSSLVQFLSPFLKALFDINSVGLTIHKVVPWFTHLKEKCTTVEIGDDQLVTNLKTHAQESLEKHFIVQFHHKVALFFNPRMNSLKILTSEDKARVLQEVKNLVQNASAENIQQRKRARNDSPLAYLEDNDQDDHHDAEREIQLYTLMRDYPTSDNLLEWWQKNSNLFPTLSNLARTFLVIPASSKPTREINQIMAKIDRHDWGEEVRPDDLVFLHSQGNFSS